jgi:hypothetical protein
VTISVDSLFYFTNVTVVKVVHFFASILIIGCKYKLLSFESIS